jgi:hypothetical protein
LACQAEKSLIEMASTGGPPLVMMPNEASTATAAKTTTAKIIPEPSRNRFPPYGLTPAAPTIFLFLNPGFFQHEPLQVHRIYRPTGNEPPRNTAI